MTAPVTVFATTASYRAAVAELPIGARQAEVARGAVVVVPGEGEWWKELFDAEAHGAVAAVVVKPRQVPAGAVAALSGRLSIPVAVERPLVRQDDVASALAARGGSPATLVTVECAAPSEGLESALRDALRWAATLADGQLEGTSGYLPPSGGMALLQADGGAVPVTVLTGRLAPDAAVPVLRVTALGEVRSTVESEAFGFGIHLTTSSANGSMLAAARYEGPARLALRRALAAAAQGATLPDIAELLEDQRLVAQVLDEHNQG